MFHHFHSGIPSPPFIKTGNFFTPFSDPEALTFAANDVIFCIPFRYFVNCKPTLTYSLWIKMRTPQLMRGTAVFSTTLGRLGFTFTNSGTTFIFRIAVTSSREWRLSFVDASVLRRNWNQFTFTLDDSKRVCAFINGRRKHCQATASAVSYSTHPGNFYIGGTINEADVYFDDFAVWNTVLEEEEIHQLYINSK